MATVISEKKAPKHDIQKYSFKVLAIGADDSTHIVENSNDFQKASFVNSSPKRDSSEADFGETKSEETQNSHEGSSSKDELVESLLKKTDEMSSNFIKLQMKLENMAQEHEAELERVKKSAYEEGATAAKAELESDDKSNTKMLQEQLKESITTLDGESKRFQKALDDLMDELSVAAVDIAKEVLEIELESSSKDVAKSLARGVIEELKDASKITLRLNPQDYTYVSTQLADIDNVRFVADKAVSQGGVVALSDVGNIDSQIQKRFQSIKKAALES